MSRCVLHGLVGLRSRTRSWLWLLLLALWVCLAVKMDRVLLAKRLPLPIPVSLLLPIFLLALQAAWPTILGWLVTVLFWSACSLWDAIVGMPTHLREKGADKFLSEDGTFGLESVVMGAVVLLLLFPPRSTLPPTSRRPRAAVLAESR